MPLPSTPFTRLVGCRLPLQQAGMGAIATPALAGSVAAEGGLGMIAAAGLSPDAVVDQVRAALDVLGDGGRIGVNFLVPFLDQQALDAHRRSLRSSSASTVTLIPRLSGASTTAARSAHGRSARRTRPAPQRPPAAM
jgi:NAD(P)H-dependent flavin oxidoreductase YrpB (nitropropane dioxygenase family)